MHTWKRTAALDLQQDVLALRTTALIGDAKHILAEAKGAKQYSRAQKTVKASLWPTITDDLEMIARSWNRTSPDVWKETNASSFFTLSASHRALVEGLALSETLNRTCDGCTSAVPQIFCFMISFWGDNYMHANLNAKDQRSGIDASSILSSINTYDPQAGCTNSTFQPCSSRALANHKTVTDSFRPLYGINNGIAQGQGVAVGRYPEDSDHGGNPWYVTTLAAAEQLYLARLQWLELESLTVDQTSLPFFRDLLPGIHVGTYGCGDLYTSRANREFKSILSTVRDYADSYLAIVQNHGSPDHGFPEQFSQDNGTPMSNSSFAWSNTAYNTTINRRAGLKGDSWGEPLNNAVDTSQCYCHARVTFQVRSDPGIQMFVVGNVPELGNWNTSQARWLNDGRPSLDDHHQYYANYSSQLDVPALSRITYHYYMRADTPHEEIHNRHRFVYTGECGSNVDTVGDVFYAGHGHL